MVPVANELEDDMIEHLLAQALAPYRSKFAPERLQAVRDALGDVLAAHPTARATVRSLLPDAAVDQSGSVRNEDATESAEEERRRKEG